LQQGTVKNVEVVNIDAQFIPFGLGEINAAKFQGVQQIWQSGVTSNVFNVADSTVVGFRGEVSGYNDITAADTATSVNIKLDNVEEYEGDVMIAADAEGEYFGVYAEGKKLNEVN